MVDVDSSAVAIVTSRSEARCRRCRRQRWWEDHSRKAGSSGVCPSPRLWCLGMICQLLYKLFPLFFCLLRFLFSSLCFFFLKVSVAPEPTQTKPRKPDAKKKTTAPPLPTQSPTEKKKQQKTKKTKTGPQTSTIIDSHNNINDWNDTFFKEQHKIITLLLFKCLDIIIIIILKQIRTIFFTRQRERCLSSLCPLLARNLKTKTNKKKNTLKTSKKYKW